MGGPAATRASETDTTSMSSSNTPLHLIRKTIALAFVAVVVLACQSNSGTETPDGAGGTEGLASEQVEPAMETSLATERGADTSATSPSLTGEEIDVRIGIIDWTRDYDRGLAIAKRLGKPVLLHFGEHPG